MKEEGRQPARQAFVVLQEISKGEWRFLAEILRQPGLSAHAARTRAIVQATGGKAKAGEVYAAVLRSEWLVAQKWEGAAPGT